MAAFLALTIPFPKNEVLPLPPVQWRMALGRDDFEPEFAPAREGEVERTALDTFLAAELLGWRAERTIETGLRQTLGPGPDPL